MLKSILNLNGVQELKKDEQKVINGGSVCPPPQNQRLCEAVGGYWFGSGCLYPTNYCY